MRHIFVGRYQSPVYGCGPGGRRPVRTCTYRSYVGRYVRSVGAPANATKAGAEHLLGVSHIDPTRDYDDVITHYDDS